MNCSINKQFRFYEYSTEEQTNVTNQEAAQTEKETLFEKTYGVEAVIMDHTDIQHTSQDPQRESNKKQATQEWC